MYLKLRKLLIGDEKIKVIGSKKNNLKKKRENFVCPKIYRKGTKMLKISS
jgi:hypothetical protein